MPDRFDDSLFTSPIPDRSTRRRRLVRLLAVVGAAGGLVVGMWLVLAATGDDGEPSTVASSAASQ